MLKTLFVGLLAGCATLFAALFSAGILTAIILFIDTLVRGYTPAAVAHGGALGLFLICFVFCFPAAIAFAVRQWLRTRQ